MREIFFLPSVVLPCLSTTYMGCCVIATMTLIFAFQRFPKMPQCWNSIFYNVLDLQGWNVEVHWCFTLQTLCGQIPCELYLTNRSKSNKSPSKLTIFTDPTKKTNQNPPINSKSQQHKQRNSSKPRFFLVKKKRRRNN